MGRDNASNYKRYGGRINSEHILLKAKNHDVITIGENVSYWYHRSHDENHRASGSNWSGVSVFVSSTPLISPTW